MMLTIETAIDIEQGTFDLLTEHLARTGQSTTDVLAGLIDSKLAEYLWEQNILKTVAAHEAGELETISLQEMKARFDLEN